MDKKTSKRQYLIGSALAGAASALCLAFMKRIEQKMQKKNSKKNDK